MRLLTFTACAAVCVLVGCSNYRSNETADAGRDELHEESLIAVKRFKQEDPDMVRFFENSYGYAVFPDVKKGGIGIGGAYGRGEVYERGVLVGYAELKQGTIGAQLGGQSYREIVFFEDKAALEHFKNDHTEFSAQASAVAASKGSSADADYHEGVAIFTLPVSGLMFEASVGGQKFDFDHAPEMDDHNLAVPSDDMDDDLDLDDDLD